MRFVWLAVLSSILAACAGSPERIPSNQDAMGGAGGSGGTDGAGGSAVLVPASSRDISFASAANDGLVHVGTLQLPAHEEGVKLPAVIFAHGSGPHTRDESLGAQLGMSFGFQIPVFVELGQALQDAGFVVLRFDKRSCGPFNGCAQNGYPAPGPDVTIDTFVADVEGGLAFLAAQPEVDPQRLFFLGHSKGASYAPRLLASHPTLRAGVMLAAPFATIDEMYRYQTEKLAELMAATGASPAQIDAVLGDGRRLADDLEALRAGTFAGTQIGGLSLAYWRSWLDLGEEAPGLASALDRPLLILSGDYDWNVPAAETEGWATHLGPDSLHRTQVVPCVSHVLNCIDNTDWRRLRPGDFGKHVDRQVIDAVVGFLGAHR